MSEYSAIIFDLDGTLLDTLEDIADSMNTVLNRFGYRAQSIDSYRYYVGDGLENLIKRVTGNINIGKSEIKDIKRNFKKEYEKRWNLKTKPYHNILDLLNSLQNKGIKMAVLSNKPDGFARIMASYYFPEIRFECVIGEKRGYPIKPDPFFAVKISKDLNIPPKHFVYLGDTKTDMETALNAKMLPVGALWGFRTEEELLSSGAKFLVSDPLEVLKFFY
ncbi:MAG: HAD family hydrolase [Brevinematia bacterium]